MSTPTKSQVLVVVESIKTLEPRLEQLATVARTRVRSLTSEAGEPAEIERWCHQINYDSITRVRNLIENNFHAIETLALLSLARYMFELNVQLKQIDQDAAFALVYARRVLEQQVEFYDRLAAQLKAEVELYLKLGKARASKDEIFAAIADRTCLYQDELERMPILQVAMVVDTQARKHALEQSELNRTSLTEFDAKWSYRLKDPKYSQKKWDKRANSVGMQEDYAFIYSYTSRLMHATPASISTAQQVLQDSELLLFMRYIRQQMTWLHDRAAMKYTPPTVH
jgi:hypothetical protein